MKNDNYKFLKSSEQSTESNQQIAQLENGIVDAVVIIVRVTLLVGFILGALCMGIIDRIMN